MNRKRSKANDILSQNEEEEQEQGDDNDHQDEQQDYQDLTYKGIKKSKGNNGKAQRVVATASQRHTLGRITILEQTLESTAQEKSKIIKQPPVTSVSSELNSFSQQIQTSKESQNNISDQQNDGFLELSINDLYTQLQEVLHTESTVILRDAADKLGFNINPKELFGFDNVLANHSEIQIECRVQNQNISDSNGFNYENYKEETVKMTLKEYGEYIRLQEEQNYEEIKNKQYFKNQKENHPTGVISTVKINMDDIHWQLETTRFRCSLPQFLVNKGKYDLLAYHRLNVNGCTQPQMILSTPGAWIGGYQENKSVRVININHGEGENVWYCIDSDQVEKYREYVKAKHSVDIFQCQGMWFRSYQDTEVARAGIKIKRIIQKKGDIVILGPGVLHWVRSVGKSVQTTWNFSFRTTSDILAIHQRYQLNQKLNIHTVILNKTLFMDLLNFEYYTLDQELTGKLLEIVQEYYENELAIQNTLMSKDSSIPVSLRFYDQLPAQLRQLQIYYCSKATCGEEIFSYFGVLRSQFLTVTHSSRIQKHNRNAYDLPWLCEYFCPKCLHSLQIAGQEIVIFRKFDLHSLRILLERVREYLSPSSEEIVLYPIEELTNVNHFCGQIQHANDFIFNKNVQKLEQLSIPDLYLKQGFGEMQRHQLDMQSEKGGLLGFQNREIEKFKVVMNGRKNINIQKNNYIEQSKENEEKILELKQHYFDELVERQREQHESIGDNIEKIEMEVDNIGRDKLVQQRTVIVRNDKKVKNKKKKKSKRLGVKGKMVITQSDSKSSLKKNKQKRVRGSNLQGKLINDQDEQVVVSVEGEVINGKGSEKEEIEIVDKQITDTNQVKSPEKTQGIIDVVLISAKQTGVQVPIVVLEQGLNNKDNNGLGIEEENEQSQKKESNLNSDQLEKPIQKKIKKKISKKKGSSFTNMSEKKLNKKQKGSQLLGVTAEITNNNNNNNNNDMDNVIHVEDRSEQLVKRSSLKKAQLALIRNRNQTKKSILLNGHNSNRNQNHQLIGNPLNGDSMEPSQQQEISTQLQQQQNEGEINQKQQIQTEEPKKRVRFSVSEELPHVSQISNRKQMLKEQVLQQEFLAKLKELEDQAKKKEKNKKLKKKSDNEGQNNLQIEKEQLLMGSSEQLKEDISNEQVEQQLKVDINDDIKSTQGQEKEEESGTINQTKHQETVDATVEAVIPQNAVTTDSNALIEIVQSQKQNNDYDNDNDNDKGETKGDDLNQNNQEKISNNLTDMKQDEMKEQ